MINVELGWFSNGLTRRPAPGPPRAVGRATCQVASRVVCTSPSPPWPPRGAARRGFDLLWPCLALILSGLITHRSGMDVQLPVGALSAPTTDMAGRSRCLECRTAASRGPQHDGLSPACRGGRGGSPHSDRRDWSVPGGHPPMSRHRSRWPSRPARAGSRPDRAAARAAVDAADPPVSRPRRCSRAPAREPCRQGVADVPR